MAEEKKSFVLYSDLIHTVRKMPAEQAGKLLLTMLEYVNDLNPVIDDMLIELVFEPIKQQMKRDLVKWETIKEKRSEAGKASAEAKKKAKEIADKKAADKAKKEQTPTKSTSVEIGQQESTKSTVSVNGNVINDDEKGSSSSATFNFFTMADFENQIQIGDNEFTLLATRQTSKTVMQLKLMFNDFVVTQKALTPLPWKSAADAKKHFIAWVNKQPKSQGIIIAGTN